MIANGGTMLEQALDYAAKGWAVFPIKAQSKEPATGRGFHDATTNPAAIRRWFGTGFPYNVAVRTGAASGVFVLDIDGDTGTASQHRLAVEYGPLPRTLISLTGNGRHFWFRTNGEIPCSNGKIAPGIDIKGDGGYVVAPPSIHPSGARYRWVNEAVPPAVAPGWLVKLAQQPKPSAIIVPLPRLPAGIEHHGPGSYGRAALEAEIAALSQVAKGGRNAALNCASFRLHQLVAGGELEGDEVEQGLIEGATANGLLADDGLRSVLATIRSGAKAGLRLPRHRQGGR